MTLEIDITVDGEGWPQLSGLETLAREAAEAALAAVPDAPAEASLSLLLTGDAQVRDLNRTWRGIDKPTNVLSFPADAPAIPGEPLHLGDVALALETLQREAEADGKSLADHLRHLIVHGVLHLVGYDHETDLEAETMEALEVAILARLGVADPYRDVAA